LKIKLNRLSLYSTHQGEILLPKSFNIATKQKISAAILSEVFASSVDNTLKQYIKPLPVPEENKNSTENLLDELQILFDSLYDKHLSIEYKEEHIRVFGAHMSLQRLKYSYEVAMFLIYMGYYFEANTIIRLILEQLIYCVNLADITDEEFKDLKPSSPLLSPTKLKKLDNLIIDLNIGSLYGDLSNKAHMNITEASKYIKWNNDIKQVMIVERSQQLTLISANLLLVICYIHESVLEYCFRDYLTTFKFIQKEGEKFISVPNKEYHGMIDRYQDILIKESQ
jgi:hypothetical protein